LSFDYFVNNMSSEDVIPEKHRLMLKEIDRLYKFYDEDPSCDNFKCLIENIKNAQQMNFNLLRTGECENHGLTQLQVHEELESLNNKHKDLKNKLLEHVCSNFKFLTLRFKQFIEKMVDGEPVDKSALEHAVHIFAQYDQGGLTENQAINKGTTYMAQRFNMPSDMFVHLED